MAVFLTDEWFAKVDELTEQAGDLNLPPTMAETKLNLNVTDTKNGDIQASFADGRIQKGSTDTDTTVNIDEETLKKIVIDGDMDEAMQAFMTGKIRIDGDMSKLMALQTAKPSAEQKALIKQIHAMTEQA